MSAATPDPGSFRDPGGRIFSDGERIFRAVYDSAAGDYQRLRDSGFLDELIAGGRLVPSRELDPRSHPCGENARYLLEHDRLPFVSYPYEWTFSQLRRAALFQLDLLIDALDRGFTLSDATAYNIQFVGSRPVFIDHLSFKPYRDGETWAAHRQFCMQFLNPLILWSRLGVAPNGWYRGNLEGIAPEELAPLLRLKDKLSLTIAGHVTAQAALQRRANAGAGGSAAPRPLTKTAFKAMLMQLKSFIAGLRYPGGTTVWDSYDSDNSYGSAEAGAKHDFVGRIVADAKPGLLFDLGCNSGDYSVTALKHGAGYVVGFDFDFGALERAVARSDEGKLPFLPLWLDATNPSPAQGWDQSERGGFDRRARGDAVIALAFIHHLAIARNIPLGAAIEWIMAIAPAGVIEFPPKSDPMTQQLLSRRDDIFPDYTEQHFVAEVAKRGRVTATEHLSEGGRLMIAFDHR